MWDRDLVSRLSPKASQVLLSLLLSRSLEVQYSSAEFAALTGLGQRSIAPALFELRSYGLIQIIQQPGKPPLVRLVHPEEYRYEATVTEVGLEHLGTAEKTALAPPNSVVGVDGGEAGAGGVQGVAVRPGGKVDDEDATEEPYGVQGHTVSEGMEHLALPNRQTAYKVHTSAPVDSKKVLTDDEEVERGLLNNCQLADQGQDAGLRIAALQDVWGYAFPVEEYPYQRLTNDAAKRLLHPTGQVNRTAEWVGGVILDAVRTARSKIVSPRAYIEKIVASAEARATKYTSDYSDQSVITDEVRRAAQLGKELFGGEKKNSSTDL